MAYSLIDDTAESVEEPPPFLKSWKRLYTLVLLNLVILILLFYAFGRTFE